MYSISVSTCSKMKSSNSYYLFVCTSCTWFGCTCRHFAGISRTAKVIKFLALNTVTWDITTNQHFSKDAHANCSKSSGTALGFNFKVASTPGVTCEPWL